ISGPRTPPMRRRRRAPNREGRERAQPCKSGTPTRISNGLAAKFCNSLDRQPFGCLFIRMDEDAVFHALADASRRALLDRLRARDGQTLVELREGLEMTRQAVSKHLAVLEGANLVATLRRGREKLHFLNPVPIHAIAARWIAEFRRPALDALGKLKS